MPDIQVGDIIRVKPQPDWKNTSGVFLVLEKKFNLMTEKTMFLCAQGSRKIWLYKKNMEKV
jgi:hypothetical protein